METIVYRYSYLTGDVVGFMVQFIAVVSLTHTSYTNYAMIDCTMVVI